MNPTVPFDGDKTFIFSTGALNSFLRDPSKCSKWISAYLMNSNGNFNINNFYKIVNDFTTT